MAPTGPVWVESLTAYQHEALGQYDRPRLVLLDLDRPAGLKLLRLATAQHLVYELLVGFGLIEKLSGQLVTTDVNTSHTVFFDSESHGHSPFSKVMLSRVRASSSA